MKNSQETIELLNEGKHVVQHHIRGEGFIVNCPHSGFYTDQNTDYPQWKFCPQCGEKLDSKEIEGK